MPKSAIDPGPNRFHRRIECHLQALLSQGEQSVENVDKSDLGLGKSGVSSHIS
jgi:hypothetical protein